MNTIIKTSQKKRQEYDELDYPPKENRRKKEWTKEQEEKMN
jgi:hypothetical protein